MLLASLSTYLCCAVYVLNVAVFHPIESRMEEVCDICNACHSHAGPQACVPAGIGCMELTGVEWADQAEVCQLAARYCACCGVSGSRSGLHH